MTTVNWCLLFMISSHFSNSDDQKDVKYVATLKDPRGSK